LIDGLITFCPLEDYLLSSRLELVRHLLGLTSLWTGFVDVLKVRDEVAEMVDVFSSEEHLNEATVKRRI
jgi:hypothetical protein